MPPLEIEFTLNKEQYKRLVRHAYWHGLPLRWKVGYILVLGFTVAFPVLAALNDSDVSFSPYLALLFAVLFSMCFPLLFNHRMGWNINVRRPRLYQFYEDHFTLRGHGSGWEQGQHVYYAVLRNKRERKGDFFFTARIYFPNFIPTAFSGNNATPLQNGETYYFIPREALTPGQAQQLRGVLGMGEKG